jgi:2,3-diketo-5-methylthio-1-phosphopentane phosphatase
MREEFRRLCLSEREAVAYVLERAQIRAGFREFCEWDGVNGHELVIVSAGVRTLIDPILDSAGLCGLHVHAGEALFTRDGSLVSFPPTTQSCVDRCGHCKRDTIRAHGPFSGPLVYVGDGYSDFCPAGDADIIFARASLARHLGAEGAPYHAFDDFFQIVAVLEQMSD